MFTIPIRTLPFIIEFARGVAAGLAMSAESADDLCPDEWVEWDDEYDINIYMDEQGKLAAAVYPIVPDPSGEGLRTTDLSRFVRLSLNPSLDRVI